VKTLVRRKTKRAGGSRLCLPGERAVYVAAMLIVSIAPDCTASEIGSVETYEHSNKLIDSISPYLLQHAHNPVDWYPWSSEALERAKREDKPIFLSIGYSACHWCHVMERESFENDRIAAVMNEHFICIKVDREERPDLDEIYMSAVRMMTGSGKDDTAAGREIPHRRQIGGVRVLRHNMLSAGNGCGRIEEERQLRCGNVQ